MRILNSVFSASVLLLTLQGCGVSESSQVASQLPGPRPMPPSIFRHVSSIQDVLVTSVKFKPAMKKTAVTLQYSVECNTVQDEIATSINPSADGVTIVFSGFKVRSHQVAGLDCVGSALKRHVILVPGSFNRTEVDLLNLEVPSFSLRPKDMKVSFIGSGLITSAKDKGLTHQEVALNLDLNG